MTLDRAVEILNEHNHLGLRWRVVTGYGLTIVRGWGAHGVINILEPFEAIAIAEKYEREDQGR